MNAVFAVVYTGGVVLNMVLGLYGPSTWTTQDWAVDLALDPRRSRRVGGLNVCSPVT